MILSALRAGARALVPTTTNPAFCAAVSTSHQSLSTYSYSVSSASNRESSERSQGPSDGASHVALPSCSSSGALQGDAQPSVSHPTHCMRASGQDVCSTSGSWHSGSAWQQGLRTWRMAGSSLLPASLDTPIRGFAAKGGAKASSGGAGGGEKGEEGRGAVRRRSDNKLYSCRNDRVRSMYEQIWPTQQLSDEEAQLFRRNSRIFITEMGRGISLKSKFAMAKAGEGRVPHTDARSLLYESDFHLDAVGEHPRYLKIRRLRAGNFAAKLQSVRKLRLLLGMERRKRLQQLYESALLTRGSDRTWKLICGMEARLGMFALRMGMVGHDALQVGRALKYCGLHVNGAKPPMPRRGFVQPADVVSVAGWNQGWQKKYVAGQLGPGLMSQVAGEWS